MATRHYYLTFCTLLLALFFSWSSAEAISWGSNDSRSQIKNNRKTPYPAQNSGPRVISLQCPRTYVGIKGELLPTYWAASDKGTALNLVQSQVQRNQLYCVYLVPAVGRKSHASVRRLSPAGYRCQTDGVGHFECRKTK